MVRGEREGESGETGGRERVDRERDRERWREGERLEKERE